MRKVTVPNGYLTERNIDTWEILVMTLTISPLLWLSTSWV